jgi:hypothetical protein
VPEVLEVLEVADLPEEALGPALPELPERPPALPLELLPEPPELPLPASLAVARLAPSARVAATIQAIAVEAICLPVRVEVWIEAMKFSCGIKKGGSGKSVVRGKYSHASKVYVGKFPTAIDLCKNFPRRCTILFFHRN